MQSTKRNTTAEQRKVALFTTKSEVYESESDAHRRYRYTRLAIRAFEKNKTKKKCSAVK